MVAEISRQILNCDKVSSQDLARFKTALAEFKANPSRAREVVEGFYASLQQFSEEEQQKRLKEILKVAVKTSRKKSGKSPKLSSTRASHPSRRPAATAR